MLQLVDVGERSLAAYQGIVPARLLNAVRAHAKDLRGARVLHLNATPYGGGVSELLRSEVPLLNNLGLHAEWKVIGGDDAFFRATKVLHNGLQGATLTLSQEEQAVYRATNARNAAQLDDRYDFIFVHDPQPAAILSLHGKGEACWVWRCHLDTSEPTPGAWGFLRPYLQGYDAAVFTMPQFVPPDLPIPCLKIIAPAIDPLSPKNFPLARSTACRILDWIGIQVDRPFVTQVARFDLWKDPLGVIAAYRLVREMFPQVQLTLVGSMALDDPEGWDIYHRLADESAADPLIHVFSNLTGVGNIEVNAFQRLSSVVVQKSIREGFGLVVSEALWKGTPVVAGRAGGIPLQMADHAVQVTHLGKPYWPRTGVTKSDMLQFYLRIAPVILPHLQNRPVTLRMYPDGVDGPSYYQRACPEHAPAWLRAAPYHPKTASHNVQLPLVDDAAGLV
jgi:trehalose synthase